MRGRFTPIIIVNLIAIDICHHKPWLLNIPRGQFVRLRRNGMRKEQYMEQAAQFEEKFIQKVYTKSL